MSLERWYALLLRAYPRPYRRLRGDELLTTLLDAAAPGARRPSWREAVDLVLGGLRYRVLPPRGPAYLVPALAGALLLGIVAATLSATVTWRLAQPAGDRTALASFVAVADPGGTIAAGHPRPAWQPVGFEDEVGARPGPAGVRMSEVTRRLTAAGWRVAPRVFGRDVSPELLAQRDGESVVVHPFSTPDGTVTGLLVSYDHRVPAVTWDGFAVGLAVGFALGWLVAAWLLRGVRDYGPVARGTLIVAGLAALTLELVIVLAMLTRLGALGDRLTAARVLTLTGSGLADSGFLAVLLVGALTVAATVTRTAPPGSARTA